MRRLTELRRWGRLLGGPIPRKEFEEILDDVESGELLRRMKALRFVPGPQVNP